MTYSIAAVYIRIVVADVVESAGRYLHAIMLRDGMWTALARLAAMVLLFRHCHLNLQAVQPPLVQGETL